MINFQEQKINFTVPTSLNFIIGSITNDSIDNLNYIYLYNKNIYTLFFITKNKILVDYTTRTIKFSSSKNFVITKKLLKTLLIFIKALFNYFFRKIKYTGKSFKIEKVTTLIFDFKFGHAKKTYVILKNKLIKQIKKTKKFYWYCNLKKTTVELNKIFFLRKWNMYTQRGLKLNKTLIYKQQGKKSTYV